MAVEIFEYWEGRFRFEGGKHSLIRACVGRNGQAGLGPLLATTDLPSTY